MEILDLTMGPLQVKLMHWHSQAALGCDNTPLNNLCRLIVKEIMKNFTINLGIFLCYRRSVEVAA